MDAKALYPSVTKAVANEAIKDLVDRSELEMKNVDYWEAAKYVAVHCSAEEIGQAASPMSSPPGSPRPPGS